MIVSDYYKILGIPSDSSVEEIKKAYRRKARLYHPDINPSPDAKDMFISITEAYEFLISYSEKKGNEDYLKAMEDWRKYRQDRSRKRATVYARTSYGSFKNTQFYKTTRIFDGTTIIFSFVISILVLVYTVYGYIFRLRHPLPDEEVPAIVIFILFLLLAMVFFVVSFIYLKAYMETSKKHKRK